MERVNVQLDDGSGKAWKGLLEKARGDGIPQNGSGIDVVTLNKATVGGNPGVGISFEVVVDGSVKRVMAVTTEKTFLAAATVLAGAKMRRELSGN